MVSGLRKINLGVILKLIYSFLEGMRQSEKNNKTMTHELKTWIEYFEEVFMGHKAFEVRKNDRNFQVGDTLILKEWNSETEKYTGRQLARNVTYILEGGQFGVEEGYVVMSI